MTFEAETMNRLTRLETKLVRGFEEMGVDTECDPRWMSVDDDRRLIYVSTIGRSLKLMHSSAIRRGATQFKEVYGIVYNGNQVATITL